MNTKNLLGISVSLIVVFALLTIGEYYQVNNLNSQLQNQSKSTLTQTSTITATSITTVTSASACAPNATCGSLNGTFAYSPTGQVRVNSVQARIVAPLEATVRNVTFSVTFENIGNSPIYFIGGWVNALSSTVASDSSVLQETASQQCPGAIFITTLGHGQNYTVFTPDCGTGFNYQLVHAGSVEVSLSFNWTTNHQETTPFSNSTAISAHFIFP